MRRHIGWAAAALIATIGLAGCSDDNGSSGDKVTSIDITIEGDQVTPNGDQIKVPVGEPIDLNVSADQPGEFHVHTSPEQEIEYPAGESTEQVTIDVPGVYELESHDLDKIVVKLEAS